MRKILIFLGLIIIGGGIWFSIQTKPDESVPTATVNNVTTNTNTPSVEVKESTTTTDSVKSIDNANVKIAFKGFGPGKFHNGSFEKIDSKLKLNDLSGMEGTVTVDMNSLTTDTEAVTKHLKTADFFDAVKYPTATFKVTKLEGADAQGGNASGVFTIKGKSKEVTFPFTLIKSNNANSIDGYTAKFNINMKEFGIDQKFANEIVELTVTVPLK